MLPIASGSICGVGSITSERGITTSRAQPANGSRRHAPPMPTRLATGTSREAIGRDAFVEQVWEWRDLYGGTIIDQFKRLGATLDYDDERFPMDERYAQAGPKVFGELYGRGRHYRATIPADRDPARRTAVNGMPSQPLTVMLDQVRATLQAEPVTRATLPPDLVRDWVAPDGHARLQVFPTGDGNDNQVIKRFRAAVATVTPAISGLPVATQAAASTVAGAFVQAGVIAFLLVSLLLFLVLRNVREVAFTLAPVVLSIFLTLATCVVIGQPINFANIIAFPLLFGVGVAFHIYFVMAWRGGATDLLQSSLARAVLFSALATGTAFGSLWLSHHPGTASMGKILMISLAWTLICALVFEPALLGPPLKAKEESEPAAA